MKVLLYHAGKILHYRISIYNYFAEHFKKDGINFTVLYNEFQSNRYDEVRFRNIKVSKWNFNIFGIINSEKPKVLITFSGLNNKFLFPLLVYCKLHGINLIYWGHGRNLMHPNRLKLLYKIHLELSDAIILYSPSQKKLISSKLKNRVFIANNTLNTTNYPTINKSKTEILKSFGINTKKNILFIGRIEKRKKSLDLIKAFQLMENKDVGLIFIGDDKFNLLPDNSNKNIHYLGPIYNNDKYNLLYSVDIVCIPGHVGLSIVDAFYYGCPLITENVLHAPEIMYLVDNINGFIVPKNDIKALSKKISYLFSNEKELKKFGDNAKLVINKNGNISNMYNGFKDAIFYTIKNKE